MEPMFTIDGRVFHAGVTSLHRGAEIRDGRNAADTMSGRKVRDLVGTFYSYTVGLDAFCMQEADYDALFELLTAPVDSHVVKFPYGQGSLTYEAYITAAEDDLMGGDEGENNWGNLSVTFYAMEPQRTPG